MAEELTLKKMPRERTEAPAKQETHMAPSISIEKKPTLEEQQDLLKLDYEKRAAKKARDFEASEHLTGGQPRTTEDFLTKLAERSKAREARVAPTDDGIDYTTDRLAQKRYMGEALFDLPKAKQLVSEYDIFLSPKQLQEKFGELTPGRAQEILNAYKWNTMQQPDSETLRYLNGIVGRHNTNSGAEYEWESKPVKSEKEGLDVQPVTPKL